MFTYITLQWRTQCPDKMIINQWSILLHPGMYLMSSGITEQRRLLKIRKFYTKILTAPVQTVLAQFEYSVLSSVFIHHGNMMNIEHHLVQHKSIALWQLHTFYCPSIINEYFSKMENWKNILNISNIWGHQTNLFLIYRLKISIENETDWYCHNLYFLIEITLKTILWKNTFQTIVKYQ